VCQRVSTPHRLPVFLCALLPRGGGGRVASCLTSSATAARSSARGSPTGLCVEYGTAAGRWRGGVAHLPPPLLPPPPLSRSTPRSLSPPLFPSPPSPRLSPPKLPSLWPVPSRASIAATASNSAFTCAPVFVNNAQEKTRVYVKTRIIAVEFWKKNSRLLNLGGPQRPRARRAERTGHADRGRYCARLLTFDTGMARKRTRHCAALGRAFGSDKGTRRGVARGLPCSRPLSS
jgi:hypothetical protein